MNTARSTRLAAAILAGALLVAAGCGDDSGDTGIPQSGERETIPTVETATTTAESTTTTADSTTTTAGGGSTTTTATDGSTTTTGS